MVPISRSTKACERGVPGRVLISSTSSYRDPNHRIHTDTISPVTGHYDVATSTLSSASGYGGKGALSGVGDGLVRIVNGGDIATQQRGTVCSYIYVFDDIEEMRACCGCPVTPDGLQTMSVINNLTKNFGVNRGNLNAGVIEIASGSTGLDDEYRRERSGTRVVWKPDQGNVGQRI